MAQQGCGTLCSIKWEWFSPQIQQRVRNMVNGHWDTSSTPTCAGRGDRTVYKTKLALHTFAIDEPARQRNTATSLRGTQAKLENGLTVLETNRQPDSPC